MPATIELTTMENKKGSRIKILSVMFGFFIMGFVDIIGIAINYVKKDFTFLTDTDANMLAMSCFFWFLILSVPTGMLMNKIGRRNTVLFSFFLHVIALITPVIAYDFSFILVAFGFLGIGNTLLQVALNPLLTDVVSREKLTGVLTLGQFVKAICSFLGPLIAAWAGTLLFGWRLIFPIYAAISLIALIWLWLTSVKESERRASVSLTTTLNLFKNRYILAFFFGILVLVGVDVGMNVTFPKLLMEKCGLELSKAGLGNSAYFFARTLGALLGGIFLLKYEELKFFKYSVLLSMVGLLGMFVTDNLWMMLVSVVLFGLGYANLFSIIFSWSLKRVPDKANEVSALLIMGVSGGAIVTPVLGIASDFFGTQTAALAVIGFVWLYLVWLSTRLKTPGFKSTTEPDLDKKL